MSQSLPKVLRTKAEMGEVQSALRSSGETIGLVPTMGFLHEGHLSLVRIARKQATKTVVSIFVNPKQFNVASDLDRYPRDEARDLALLSELAVDYVFIPDQAEVYPDGFESEISLSELTKDFEGQGRPGHFAGVTTVLTILFHIVNPHLAVFGEKDFQQLRVVEKMVEDLVFPLRIVRAPLVREEDGLAMSSRNVLLSKPGRQAALALSRSLFRAVDAYQKQERDSAKLKEIAHEELKGESAVTVEYLEIVKEENLSTQSGFLSDQERCRILVTAYVEGVRLLDNVRLKT